MPTDAPLLEVSSLRAHYGTALAVEDYDAIQELKSTDTSWWNVAWTLALLLRGYRAGDDTSVKLVDDLMTGGLDEPPGDT